MSSVVVRAHEGTRLDELVYKHYGTLTPFTLVLEANPTLHAKKALEAGDEVVLPQWAPPKEREVKALW